MAIYPNFARKIVDGSKAKYTGGFQINKPAVRQLLLARIQIDIADLDSIQLCKDRKGWLWVRVAFFCFN